MLLEPERKQLIRSKYNTSTDSARALLHTHAELKRRQMITVLFSLKYGSSLSSHRHKLHLRFTAQPLIKA